MVKSIELSVVIPVYNSAEIFPELYSRLVNTLVSTVNSFEIIVMWTALWMKGAYIGMNASILPGVTIGENAIIGAGAVVTKDIQSNYTALGVPAKVVQ